MPNRILPVTGLDTVGLIKDQPPSGLPPQAFSDAQNVRFRDGAVLKMQGDVNIFPFKFYSGDSDGTGIDSDAQIKYCVWWPNPNLVAEYAGYYLLIVQHYDSESDRQRDHAYIVKPGGTPVLKGIFEPDENGDWQHTFFQGGFCLIINNGQDVPHYILDPEGNTDIDMVPDFAQLPGWDKYNVNEILLDDVFNSARNSLVFDLGQLVDYTVNAIAIQRTAAGANDPDSEFTVDTDTEVAGVLTTSTDTETNTTIITFDSEYLMNGDRIQIIIRSREVVVVRCGVIRTFGDFLVAANLREVEETDPDVIVRNLPGVVRSSDVAAPGSIPNNWNPFAFGGTNTAAEFVVTQEGIVQDMVELQGTFYIYSNSSIAVMRQTGNVNEPLTVTPLTDSYGCQTTDAVINFDGQHFVVGSQDIFIFGGHPGNIQSVADGRVREYFYQNLNPLHIDRMFVIRHRQKDEIWICYPTKESIIGTCDEALIWNYRKNNWTVRDLQGVVSGDVGPIPGGGVPTLGVDLDGESGDSGIESLGAREIQTILIDPNTTLPGDNLVGRQTTYDITVEGIEPYETSGAPIFDFVLEPGFSTGISQGLYFNVVAYDSDDDILFTYETQLPTGWTRENNQEIADFLDSDTDFTAHMNAIAPNNSFELIIEFHDTDVINANVSFGNKKFFTKDELTRDSESDLIPSSDQTDTDNDSECIINAAIYVDLNDVGKYYYLNLGDNFDPVPDGTMFEILSGIGDGETEFLYDGRDGKDPTVRHMYGDSDSTPEGPRGGLTERPYADGVGPPQFMYRYRAFTADRDVEEARPWVPNTNGIYQVRITIPRTGGQPPCPESGDWKLDAYANNNVPTDGMGQVGIQDLVRSTHPFDPETLEGAAPIIRWLNGTLRYSEDPDTEVRMDTEFVFSSLGGSYILGTDIDSEIAEHIAHDFHDQSTSFFDANDSENVAKLISRISGSYWVDIDMVAANDHPVSVDNFTIERTQHGWWPWASNPTQEQLDAGVIQAIYPRIYVNKPANAVTGEGQEDTLVRLVNTNNDTSVDVDDTGIIRQFDQPIDDFLGWATMNVPSELSGVVQISNGVTMFTTAGDYTGAAEPAERALGGQWSMSIDKYGNVGLKEDGWDPVFTNAFNQSDVGDVVITEMLDYRGQWRQYSIPTYMALLVSNGTDPENYPEGLELVILRAGDAGDYNPSNDDQTGTNGVSYLEEPTAERWVEQLRFINPRLSALDRGTEGQFIIQPANYSDASSFVLDSAINDTQEGVDLMNMWIFTMMAQPDTTVAARSVQPNPNNQVLVRNYERTTGAQLEMQLASNSPEAVIDTDYTQFNPGNRVPNQTSTSTPATLRNTEVRSDEDKVFDVDRPWADSEVNFNLYFPILASYNIVDADYRVNKILAADIGWSRPAISRDLRVDTFPGLGVNRVIQGQDEPEPYYSQATRMELPITPEFNTETVASIAVLADGFYKPGFFDSDVYNRLVLNAYGTNAPGQRFETFSRQNTNVFYLTEDYKNDLRIHGRFINITVGDEAPREAPVTIDETYKGKSYTQEANWRVNGLQLEIMEGGTR